MPYQCHECLLWQKSESTDRHGRKWCEYSRKWEEYDQPTYGCRGFIWVERYILTRICTILHLPVEEWFAAFDDVKDHYVAKEHPEWIAKYQEIGPKLAAALDADPHKEDIAMAMLASYLKPAFFLYEENKYDEVAELYREMVQFLDSKYT